MASQTLENIAIVDSAAQMPILRPLIGSNKNDIVDIARQIGTFPVSIIPDQDCCSLFVPRHPVTKGNAKVVERLEASLPVDELVERAVEGVETRRFGYSRERGAQLGSSLCPLKALWRPHHQHQS